MEWPCRKGSRLSITKYVMLRGWMHRVKHLVASQSKNNNHHSNNNAPIILKKISWKCYILFPDLFFCCSGAKLPLNEILVLTSCKINKIFQ